MGSKHIIFFFLICLVNSCSNSPFLHEEGNFILPREYKWVYGCWACSKDTLIISKAGIRETGGLEYLCWAVTHDYNEISFDVLKMPPAEAKCEGNSLFVRYNFKGCEKEWIEVAKIHDGNLFSTCNNNEYLSKLTITTAEIEDRYYQKQKKLYGTWMTPNRKEKIFIDETSLSGEKYILSRDGYFVTNNGIYHYNRTKDAVEYYYEKDGRQWIRKYIREEDVNQRIISLLIGQRFSYQEQTGNMSALRHTYQFLSNGQGVSYFYQISPYGNTLIRKEPITWGIVLGSIKIIDSDSHESLFEFTEGLFNDYLVESSGNKYVRD